MAGILRIALSKFETASSLEERNESHIKICIFLPLVFFIFFSLLPSLSWMVLLMPLHTAVRFYAPQQEGLQRLCLGMEDWPKKISSIISVLS